ncbi:7315_t:CDS:2, partial [Acaulospora colombiana]
MKLENASLPPYLHDSPFDSYNKSLINPILLPSRWNPEDHVPDIQILEDGVRLAYIGPGRNCASAKSNHPISSKVGIYYFEIEIIDEEDHGWAMHRNRAITKSRLAGITNPSAITEMMAC